MSARLQHASNFREGAILRLAGWQVMQHQDRDDGGESFTGEREHRGIALHDMDFVNDKGTWSDPGVLHVTGTLHDIARLHNTCALHGMGVLNAAALNHIGAISMPVRKLARETVVVLEAGDAGGAALQLARSGACACSDFEHV